MGIWEATLLRVRQRGASLRVRADFNKYANAYIKNRCTGNNEVGGEYHRTATCQTLHIISLHLWVYRCLQDNNSPCAYKGEQPLVRRVITYGRRPPLRFLSGRNQPLPAASLMYATRGLEPKVLD